MKCKCDYIKTTRIILEKGKKITLNTGAINQSNLNDFCIILAQSIPNDATTEQVYICPTNAPSYVLNSVSGNYVRIDQLRCRKAYPVVFGNDPNHYSLTVRVGNTGYEVV